MIYIGFSKQKGFKPFAWIIQWWQGGTDFAHAYIRFYDYYTRQWVIVEARRDVHIVEWENWKALNTTTHEFALEVSSKRRREAVAFAIKNCEKPYSFLNIIGLTINEIFGFNLFKDQGKAFICSELVATIFDKELKFDKPLDYVTPKDVYDAIIELQGSNNG